MNSQSLSKERVLIVGCGDIGQRLAPLLPAEIYTTTGLRRNPSMDKPCLHFQRCDVTDPQQLSAALAPGFDTIVITMTPGERSDAGYRKAYVEVCENLVKSLQQSNQAPRLILFVSSSAVYHQMDGSWVDEDSATAPESFSGRRLLEAESIIAHSSFRHVIVRFSGIYGPGRNRLIEQVRQQQAPASRHFTNRIHADDCARVLAHLIELNRCDKPIAPLYLASDNAPVPMLDIVTWLAAQLGVKNFLAETAANERGNKRCSNQRLLAAGFQFRYPTYKEGYLSIINDK